jgi:hypothetical protein
LRTVEVSDRGNRLPVAEALLGADLEAVGEITKPEKVHPAGVAGATTPSNLSMYGKTVSWEADGCTARGSRLDRRRHRFRMRVEITMRSLLFSPRWCGMDGFKDNKLFKKNSGIRAGILPGMGS